MSNSCCNKKVLIAQQNIVTNPNWLSDSGVPANSLGNDTDHYLNTDNGDVYEKVAGAWVLEMNLTGPAGADGLDGTNGVDGNDGADGLPGAAGADGTDGVVQSVVAGTNVTVDNTDPANPIVNSSATLSLPAAVEEVEGADSTYVTFTNSVITGGTLINYYWYTLGKQVNVWITGRIDFTAGVTFLEGILRLPTINTVGPFTGTMPEVGNQFASVAAINTGAKGLVGAFNYETDGAGSPAKDNIGVVYVLGTNPTTLKFRADTTIVDSQLFIGMHITLPVS